MRVVHVRAGNPGPFTLEGTNTYVVGDAEGTWVVDPGPAMPHHLDAVAFVVGASGAPWRGVLLTHDHSDHAEGARGLLERAGSAPVCAASGAGDVRLVDGDGVGPFTVVATPGHAPDHLAFVAGPELFSGDAVLGRGSVFLWPSPGALRRYVAALERLRAAAGIDGRRVGVWGHSQGGWLVQILAARNPDLSFAVTNSGSAAGIERQDHYGWEQTLRAEGAADQDIAAALAFLRSVQEAARRGDDFAAVEERLVRHARGQPWYGYLELEDADDWGHERRFIQEAYQPIEALAHVRCPFLAVFGALDVLVNVWESAQLCGQALRDAGNPDATVVVFPQGNHRIQLEETRQFVPGYLELLGDWALHRVARR